MSPRRTRRRGWALVAQSTTAVSHTGTAVETALTDASCVLPAGSMGPRGRVRITTQWSVTNSANAKTLRTYFGASLAANIASTTSATVLDQAREIVNAGAANSQRVRPSTQLAGGVSTSALTTLSIDTTADVTIAFRALLANAGETITLESWSVEVLYGA